MHKEHVTQIHARTRASCCTSWCVALPQGANGKRQMANGKRQREALARCSVIKELTASSAVSEDVFGLPPKAAHDAGCTVLTFFCRNSCTYLRMKKPEAFNTCRCCNMKRFMLEKSYNSEHYACKLNSTSITHASMNRMPCTVHIPVFLLQTPCALCCVALQGIMEACFHAWGRCVFILT